MKRRNFIETICAGGVAGAFSGCAAGKNRVKLCKEQAPFIKRPVGGSIPVKVLGKTGIKISAFGFGSHIREDMVPFEKQREYMIREAIDLGINLFDVYDEYNKMNQYEPMGRYLKHVINDVIISTPMIPFNGRNLEQEFERALRLFGRDHLDLVRCHGWKNTDPIWKYWDKLFEYKEKGQIRAVGIPIHDIADLEQPLKDYPMDYVILPYNFYHNIGWLEEKSDDFDPLVSRLRDKGIGVITMKPLGGDFLVRPFIEIARKFSKYPEINFPKAALHYVINSGIKPDSTLAGMYNISDLYENVEAYCHPEMSDEERKLLESVKKAAWRETKAMLPKHYTWLENWKGLC